MSKLLSSPQSTYIKKTALLRRLSGMGRHQTADTSLPAVRQGFSGLFRQGGYRTGIHT